MPPYVRILWLVVYIIHQKRVYYHIILIILRKTMEDPATGINY